MSQPNESAVNSPSALPLGQHADRVPRLGAALALLAPFLGALLCGRPWRAAAYFCGALLLYVVGHGAVASGWWNGPGWSFPPLLALHCLAAYDVFRHVRRYGISARWFARWPALLAIAALVWVSALSVTRYLWLPFHIGAASMAPTLIQGDRVLARPLHKEQKGQLQRGDLVIFRLPGTVDETYVKRVIALPGDEVRFENQSIAVNGDPLDRTKLETTNSAASFKPRWLDVPHYIEQTNGKSYEIMIAHPDEGPRGELTVPPGHYFVLGDNRNFSNDSRFLGPIPFDGIVGTPTFVWWSAVSEGDRETRWERMGRRLH